MNSFLTPQLVIQLQLSRYRFPNVNRVIERGQPSTDVLPREVSSMKELTIYNWDQYAVINTYFLFFYS